MSTTAFLSPWVLVMGAYPIGSKLYGRGVRILLGRVEDTHPATRYASVALAALLAGWYLVLETPPLFFEPAFALFLPAGFALYELENSVLSWLSGRQAASGFTGLAGVLPVLPGAVFEEVLFREALSSLIETSVLLYLSVSAVLFGALHLPNRQEALCKVIDGVAYASIYVSTGTVLAPIVAHVGFNLGYVRQATGFRVRG